MTALVLASVSFACFRSGFTSPSFIASDAGNADGGLLDVPNADITSRDAARADSTALDSMPPDRVVEDIFTPDIGTDAGAVRLPRQQ